MEEVPSWINFRLPNKADEDNAPSTLPQACPSVPSPLGGRKGGAHGSELIKHMRPQTKVLERKLG